MELFEKMLALLFQIHDLLKLYFELPLSLFVAALDRLYFRCNDIQFSLDLQVNQLLFLQLVLLGLGLVKWLCHVLVGPIVLGVFFLRLFLFLLACGQLFFEELDDVQIGRSNLLIIFFYLVVLLLVLQCTLLNLGVLPGFDLLDASAPPLFHFSSQVDHPLLVLQLYFVAESLVVIPHLSHLFVEGTMQSVSIFLLSGVLLLL